MIQFLSVSQPRIPSWKKSWRQRNCNDEVIFTRVLDTICVDSSATLRQCGILCRSENLGFESCTPSLLLALGRTWPNCFVNLPCVAVYRGRSTEDMFRFTPSIVVTAACKRLTLRLSDQNHAKITTPRRYTDTLPCWC